MTAWESLSVAASRMVAVRPEYGGPATTLMPGRARIELGWIFDFGGDDVVGLQNSLESLPLIGSEYAVRLVHMRRNRDPVVFDNQASDLQER